MCGFPPSIHRNKMFSQNTISVSTWSTEVIDHPKPLKKAEREGRNDGVNMEWEKGRSNRGKNHCHPSKENQDWSGGATLLLLTQWGGRWKIRLPFLCLKKEAQYQEEKRKRDTCMAELGGDGRANQRRDTLCLTSMFKFMQFRISV